MRQCGFVWCLRICFNVPISILGQTCDKFTPSQSMCVWWGVESRVFGFRVRVTLPARVCLRHSVLLLEFPEFWNF